MNLHYFDPLGICIFCDQCNDPNCCDATNHCDRHLIEDAFSRANALVEQFIEERRSV